MDNGEITFFVGQSLPESHTRVPFDDLSCTFLENVSQRLKSDPRAKTFPDIMTFAFWCRAGNIARLKENFNDGKARLGKGLVFHISPSNVPVNFAFSFAFGLLSGNSNIVRVPSKAFAQTEIICQAIQETLKEQRFEELKNTTTFISYVASDNITAQISKKCQARIIWGGDETVKAVRAYPLAPRGVDIEFSDRYSFSILDAHAVSQASEQDLERLCRDFFNDTYMMDQGACSSPHLVFWLGNQIQDAKERFWKKLSAVAEQEYQLADIKAVDKYTQFCRDAVSLETIQDCRRYGGTLYVVALTKLPHELENLRGQCGYFYEYSSASLDILSQLVNSKFQTVTYYGVDKSKILDFVMKNRLPGIDRIVPVGRALEIDVTWDGYEILKCLTRVIEVS